MVASPLHMLTSTQTPFEWTPQAKAAFKRLKSCFTSAPVLMLTDPSCQFVVEVLASDVGVETALSQRMNQIVSFTHVLSCPGNYLLQSETTT